MSVAYNEMHEKGMLKSFSTFRYNLLRKFIVVSKYILDIKSKVKVFLSEIQINFKTTKWLENVGKGSPANDTNIKNAIIYKP